MAKILIADDNPRNRGYLVNLLRHCGHDLLEAADGGEALALVQADRPDLVIADLLMPTLDGYELVRRMRGDAAIGRTPVIFHSAAYDEREVQTLASACGVTHILRKRAAPKTVLSLVGSVLGTVQSADPDPLPLADFDREHLRPLTNKLSQKADALEQANKRLTEILRLGQEHAARLEMEVGQRREAERALRRAYEELECRVEERTSELCSEIAERRRAEAALEERVRREALGALIGRAMTQAAPLRTMLEQCALGLLQHLDAAFVRIWTLGPAENVLELQASAGLYTHIDGAHARVPVGKFKIGLIAQERRPHLTNDIAHDKLISDPDWARREGMVAYAGHPFNLRAGSSGSPRCGSSRCRSPAVATCG